MFAGVISRHVILLRADPDKSDHIAEDAVMLSAYDCEVFYAMAPVAECTVETPPPLSNAFDCSV